MSNIDNSYAVKLASYLGHVNGLRVKQAFLEGMDPTAQAALLAGGAGAAVGGIGNALFGKRKKGVGMLGRLGRGALAGGGIGALGGAGLGELALRRNMDTDQFGPDARRHAANPVAGITGLLSNLFSRKSDLSLSPKIDDAAPGPINPGELKLNLPNVSTPGPNYGILPPGSPTGPLADVSTRPDLSDILGLPQGPIFKNSPFPLEKLIPQDFRSTVNESFKKDPRYGTNFFRSGN